MTEMYVGTLDTRNRFKTVKAQARQRMDREELGHEEFLNLLLDVYELHLEGEG